MNELTSSLELAKATGKNHGQVLIDIREMCRQTETKIGTFSGRATVNSQEVIVIESEYEIEIGQRAKRLSKEYLLNDMAVEVLALNYNFKRRTEVAKLLVSNTNYKMDLSSIFFKIEKRKFKTYLIKDNINNYIKIGKTTDELHRFKALSQSNPNLEYMFTINKNVETALHCRYKYKRKYGEWFNLTNDDIYNIRNKYVSMKRTK